MYSGDYVIDNKGNFGRVWRLDPELKGYKGAGLRAVGD